MYVQTAAATTTAQILYKPSTASSTDPVVERVFDDRFKDGAVQHVPFEVQNGLVEHQSGVLECLGRLVDARTDRLVRADLNTVDVPARREGVSAVQSLT